jgi:hypothetical protein
VAGGAILHVHKSAREIIHSYCMPGNLYGTVAFVLCFAVVRPTPSNHHRAGIVIKMTFVAVLHSLPASQHQQQHLKNIQRRLTCRIP